MILYESEKNRRIHEKLFSRENEWITSSQFESIISQPLMAELRFFQLNSFRRKPSLYDCLEQNFI